jgi:2-iminoacetate synthase
MIINEDKINQLLGVKKANAERVRQILAKALQTKGLSFEEVAVLTKVEDQKLIEELFYTAKKIKEIIYGKRLVLFAPLYISNLCTNDCTYCAFRTANKALQRKSLTQEEVVKEVNALVDQGQKRVLLVAGESNANDSLQYILDSIKTIYSVKNKNGEIRRLNVNIAPLTVEEFRQLKNANIGTYQLFQETYHRDTYERSHLSGKKADYDWHLTTMDRAMEAGIDDVGIGVLFGLADWRFELLALMQHTQHLEEKFGIGPHTISIPRIEPAIGSEIASKPPNPVSDINFYKLIAILRLAIPYVGIILSTRETPEIRRKALSLGVSQISAGSRTNPGGYSESNTDSSQFSLGDHRSLDEVISEIAMMGYIPSFCTACYRLGRTGEHFMELAKPGDIKSRCFLNALTTFQEYLLDYASAKTKKMGENLLHKELKSMSLKQRQLADKLIDQINDGQRDVFV